MDMKRILQAMDGVATKPVAGANDMARFLRVVDEAAMYGAGNTGVKTAPQSASQLSPEQVKQLAPYLETDPSDGSKYYDLPATDPKEIGAVMGTMIKSPAYIASRKQEQGMVIQQLLALQDPKNRLKPDETTWQPASDEETAQALGFMKENTLSKFLSIVKKNDVKILNEGANPHKVALPVQMAMQHYQKPETKIIERKSTLIDKFFNEVEQEKLEEQSHKQQLINQYAGIIAQRVMMKESIVSEKSTTEKQARTMAAAAHNPEFAKKVGIKQSVAKEFNQKDKGTALLSNAMKGKRKVKENEIPGHSMGFKPGPGGPGIMPNEAHDPNFTGFMNKALGTRQDKKPLRVDPKTVMSMNNMPGYKHAFKFGMDIIKKMDPDTKEHFANEDDDALESYMIDIAEKKGLIPKYFVEEDLSEVVGEFEEIFHDPEMEGWSWADLLRDMIGQEPMAHEKANVQAHKQMMAKAQAEKDNPPPIDPNKLKVVDRTDTGKSEIWYPSGGFFGTNSWAVVQGGFKDKAHAENTLHQLKANPNVVNIIKKAIADDLDEGQSAQVKLSRAWDREKAKSTASIERAKKAKSDFEKDWKEKQEKKSQESNPIKEANRLIRKMKENLGEPVKTIKPKKKTSVCRAGQVQTGMQSKNGKLVPKCSIR